MLVLITTNSIQHITAADLRQQAFKLQPGAVAQDLHGDAEFC